MMSVLKKTEKPNNEYIEADVKKAEAFVYWQAITIRPK